MNARKLLLSMLWVVLALGAASCGDDDDDGLNLSGQWTFSFTHTSNDCGIPTGETDTIDITITQSGNSIQIVDANGDRLNGTLSGSTMDFSGTVNDVTDQGCAVRITYDGEGTASSNRISGSFQTTVVISPQGGCNLSGQCAVNWSFTMNRR